MLRHLPPDMMQRTLHKARQVSVPQHPYYRRVGLLSPLLVLLFSPLLSISLSLSPSHSLSLSLRLSLLATLKNFSFFVSPDCTFVLVPASPHTVHIAATSLLGVTGGKFEFDNP